MFLYLVLHLSLGILVELIPKTGTPPSSRQYTHMYYHEAKNSLITFGGNNESGDFFNSIFIYSLDTN